MILVPFFSWIVLEHDHVLGAYYFVSNVLFCLNYLPKLWNCHHTYLSQHEFYKSSVLQNLNGQWSFGFMGGPPSLAKLGSNISLVEEEISGFKFFMWHHKTAKKPVTQRHSGAGLFRKKNTKKSTCAIMIRNIVTFANHISLLLIWLYILEIWSKFQKLSFWKKLHKGRESFSPNADNFLAFFIVFQRGRILESAMDK